MKQNEMMDRAVINEDVRKYLRESLPALQGDLKLLQEEATEKRVPVIPHETVAFLRWFLPTLQPRKVLEVGTAIGFSAAVMAEVLGKEVCITTIERNLQMVERAKQNFVHLGIESQMTILEGQADTHLDKLNDTYQFIFMDSAKAKYYDFFPNCMRLLSIGGVLAVDDVLQGGTITETLEDIPRRRRTIHKKLNLFLDAVLNCPYIDTTILPIGDGLLLITKKEEQDFGAWLEEYEKNS